MPQKKNPDALELIRHGVHFKEYDVQSPHHATVHTDPCMLMLHDMLILAAITHGQRSILSLTGMDEFTANVATWGMSQRLLLSYIQQEHDEGKQHAREHAMVHAGG